MYCTKCGAAMPDPTEHEGKYCCQVCGHIAYLNPAPCVSILIVSEDRILLGFRGETSIMPRKWCLPCGHIEKNESYIQAALREVYEETNIRIRLMSILNVVTNHFSNGMDSLVIVLLGEPLTEDIRAGDDLCEVRWFPLCGPFPNMAFKADIRIIEQYRQYRQLLGIPLTHNQNLFYEKV